MLDRAGLVGADGSTHAGSFDLAYLLCLPNVVVMAPSDENELKDMIYTSSLYNSSSYFFISNFFLSTKFPGFILTFSTIPDATIAAFGVK